MAPPRPRAHARQLVTPPGTVTVNGERMMSQNLHEHEARWRHGLDPARGLVDALPILFKLDAEYFLADLQCRPQRQGPEPHDQVMTRINEPFGA